MDEKDEKAIKNGNRKEEKDLCKEIINGILCRKNLHPFFEHSNHSINNVYFSKVNTFIMEYCCKNKVK